MDNGITHFDLANNYGPESGAAEMALSWILKDGIVTTVLAGASKTSQIPDNIKAVENTDFSDEEIKKINDILIQKYEIKYSTIVVFNGAEYIVKASNVDKRHWDSLSSLQDIDMFKDSSYS